MHVSSLSQSLLPQLDSYLSLELCFQVTWLLLHFLWQGLLLGAIVFLVNAVCQKASPRFRHRVGHVTLHAMWLCVLVTWQFTPEFIPSAQTSVLTSAPLVAPGSIEPLVAPEQANLTDLETELLPSYLPELTIDEITPELAISALAAPELDEMHTRSTMSHPTSIPTSLQAVEAIEPPAFDRPASWTSKLYVWSPVAALAYLVGLALMLLRLIFSAGGVHRLRRGGQAAGTELQLRVAELSRQLGLKIQPTIQLCDRILVPFVAYAFKPTILLPASMLSGMTPAEVDAILVHEISHLRRGDIFVNYFQRFIEAVLFFHPAVWYVSHVITVERENCCDDMVLEHCDRKDYASALVRIAERCLPDASQLAPLAAIGATGKPSELKRRVLRILGIRPTESVARRNFAWLFIGIVAIAVSAVHLHAQIEATRNDQDATSHFEPVEDSTEFQVADPSSDEDKQESEQETGSFSGQVMTVFVSNDGTSMMLACEDLTRITSTLNDLAQNAVISGVEIKQKDRKHIATIKGKNLTYDETKSAFGGGDAEKVEKWFNENGHPPIRTRSA